MQSYVVNVVRLANPIKSWCDITQYFYRLSIYLSQKEHDIRNITKGGSFIYTMHSQEAPIPHT